MRKQATPWWWDEFSSMFTASVSPDSKNAVNGVWLARPHDVVKLIKKIEKKV